jgi:hypothetical protein
LIENSQEASELQINAKKTMGGTQTTINYRPKTNYLLKPDQANSVLRLYKGAKANRKTLTDMPKMVVEGNERLKDTIQMRQRMRRKSDTKKKMGST